VVAESRGQGPRRGDKPRSGGQSGRAGATGGGARSGGAGRGGESRGGESRGGPAGAGRSGAPRRGDAPRGQGGRPPRDDRRGDRRDERDDRRIRPRDDAERSAEQAKYDGPPLDPDISGKELDRNVAQQLRGLPEKLASRVARHLVAAGMLLDEDPKTAYQHTLAARARAARIAVVREACGEAAYYAGEYAEALSELRAAKRMNGNTDYLPVMADCERALGRPEKALALARNPSVANLEDSLKAEMTIVEAGARRDLGELDAALRTLENAPLRSRSRADWVARLRYAYADTLLAAGRREDAVIWFHRTVGVDSNEVTDAAERLTELESSGS
jgi:tetratricopeptide (TPR) repeat protein